MACARMTAQITDAAGICQFKQKKLPALQLYIISIIYIFNDFIIF